MRYSSIMLSLAAAASVQAYEIPSNLQSFYNKVKNVGCAGGSYVGGRHDQNDGETPDHGGFGFCTDTPGIVYLTGQNELGDMDVDCDGSGVCSHDQEHQDGTSFDDMLGGDYGIKTLNAGKIPFVVLGTDAVRVDNGDGGSGPIAPLSVVAIVCNGQLHYGVFGDTNGNDHDNINFTGEASFALTQLCFPDGVNGQKLDGNNGYTGHDILYMAFTDAKTIRADQAPWTGGSAQDFENHLKPIGDALLNKVLGGGSDTSPTTPPTTKPTKQTGPPPTCQVRKCEHAGMCFGDACQDENGCDGDLVCNSGKCGCDSSDGAPQPTQAPQPTCKVRTCENPGMCFGDACKDENGCDGDLVCNSGKCGCDASANNKKRDYSTFVTITTRATKA